jgi:hypothetical protein
MCVLNLSTCHTYIALVSVVDLVFFYCCFSVLPMRFKGLVSSFALFAFGFHGVGFVLHCVLKWTMGDGWMEGRRREWKIC